MQSPLPHPLHCSPEWVASCLSQLGTAGFLSLVLVELAGSLRVCLLGVISPVPGLHLGSHLPALRFAALVPDLMH